MSEKLLPCPFCGSSNTQRPTSSHPRVVCLDCHSCGPWDSSWHDKWNTRADLGETVNAAWRQVARLSAEVAELRAKLETNAGMEPGGSEGRLSDADDLPACPDCKLPCGTFVGHRKRLPAGHIACAGCGHEWEPTPEEREQAERADRAYPAKIGWYE